MRIIDNIPHRSCHLRVVLAFLLAALFAAGNLRVMVVDSSPSLRSSSSSSSQSSYNSTSDNKTAAVNVLHEPLSSVPHRLHPLLQDTPLKPSPHTIVTGYFRMKSKHSSTSYDGWMANMLSMQDTMVIFTSHDMVDKIKIFRSHALDKTLIVEMELDDLPVAKLYSNASFWQHQLEIDAERKIHGGYQVFWIWLSKSWLTTQAIALNPFGSDFFMWSDIGCFRNKKFNSKQVIQHAALVPTGSLLWMAHSTPNPPPNPLWNNKLKQKKHFYHSGSQAAGTVQAWTAFHQRFCETIDAFVASGLFIGEDQCVLQSTCQQHPELCVYATHNQVPDNNYFGVRTVLHAGGAFDLWRPPPLKPLTVSSTTAR